MTTVVFLLVQLEIRNQDVFVVTERVVECHCALIVGGARRLGRGIFHGKGFQENAKQGKVYFSVYAFCQDIKGLKNII